MRYCKNAKYPNSHKSRFDKHGYSSIYHTHQALVQKLKKMNGIKKKVLKKLFLKSKKRISQIMIV